MAAVVLPGGGRDAFPGQLRQLDVQAGLVAFHDQDVMPRRALPSTATARRARLRWPSGALVSQAVTAASRLAASTDSRTRRILAGWALHLTHRGWWWGILTIAALTASGLLIVGRRIGLATVAERLYASAVVAAAGGWLAAATEAGAWHDRLPQVLGIGGLILAVPWWAHRRRRARVRVERKLEAWPRSPKLSAWLGLPCFDGQG